ncbi:hypothetical protein ACJJIU_22100 (plasmid) [Microbulbifer sp. CnH-101-E]|uniref:hypothetical protein n=1 Tax=unclassified Microbulbifer TaxID=2619833 RepID=UPI0040395128
MVTAHSAQLLRLHQHYRQGNLWRGGGVGDQPNYYLEAMAAIEQLAAEFDRDE